MENSVAQRLLDLNRQFYQTFALQFSSTRQRLQPGVKRKLNELGPTTEQILDLGCGNGEFALALKAQGFRGNYLGLDASQELLDIAQKRFQAHEISTLSKIRFICRDLSTPGWEQDLPLSGFNVILAFALLHHIPGDILRKNLLDKIHALLVKPQTAQTAPLFIHSEWQFLNSERLRSRLVAWESVGLSSQDVDPGDHLLDWKHGGYGLRYVHHFTTEELERQARQSGFKILDTTYSDGENASLGLYQSWEPV